MSHYSLAYACKWCGTQRRAKASKECPADWIERLWSMLTCDECVQLMRARDEAVRYVSELNWRLYVDGALGSKRKRRLTEAERNEIEIARQRWQAKVRETLRALNERRTR